MLQEPEQSKKKAFIVFATEASFPSSQVLEFFGENVLVTEFLREGKSTLDRKQLLEHGFLYYINETECPLCNSRCHEGTVG